MPTSGRCAPFPCGGLDVADGIFQQGGPPKTVRIPVIPSPLPSGGELRIKRPPYGSIFDAFADQLNGLAGYRFLHSVPVVVAPWKWNYSGGARTGAPNVGDESQTRFVRFRTSPLARVLFVAVGYSAIRTGVVSGRRQSLGTCSVSVRYAPGNTTPGSGDLIDPGVEFRSVDGNLANPVAGNEYGPSGLKWAFTPLGDPPAVVATDPVTRFPRLLKLLPEEPIEVGITWENVSLNSILVAECYRSEA